RMDPAAAGLAGLPWEAMPDPVTGSPLALHRLLTIYRHPGPAAPAPVAAPAAPGGAGPAGPLRIVVAISAPTRGGGDVLDYEAELRAVLAAVRGARAGDARGPIVPFPPTAPTPPAPDRQPLHGLPPPPPRRPRP